ncbi:uncharacterized protein SCHCODRAFT_02520877 [Schizophyllum commune H4-8]|nr:uncharacterized protein SCHCODRAFT_02520877 [Schizophyllum commune H4-8]KAI5885270.1 hypothetical protein SCHCODRAFT_02520877 [Schizophyllum commune H4-8]
MNTAVLACAHRLCLLPFELLQQVGSHLAADDPDALDALAASCPRLKDVIASPHTGAFIFGEVFNTGAIHRRVSWIPARHLAPEASSAPPGACGIHLRPHHFSGQLQAYFENVRTPLLRRVPPSDPDAESAIMHAFIMLIVDDGRNAQMLDRWGAYDFAMAYVLMRIEADSQPKDAEQAARGACPWPSMDDELAAALWVAWHLTTEERLAAERTSQVLKILEGLLPFIVMPFRYAAGEIPPDFFYPPLGVGPQGMFLPQSLRTVHGNYPVFPRSNPPPFWPYVGYQFTFPPPLLSAVAKLHWFARRQRIHIPIPQFLAKTYAERKAAHAERVAREGWDAVGAMGVQFTQQDIHEVNVNKAVRLPWHPYPLSLPASTASASPAANASPVANASASPVANAENSGPVFNAENAAQADASVAGNTSTAPTTDNANAASTTNVEDAANNGPSASADQPSTSTSASADGSGTSTSPNATASDAPLASTATSTTDISPDTYIPPPASLVEPFLRLGRQPAFTKSMAWDTDAARCIMSNSAHVAYDPRHPPSQLADSIRLGQMYQPGSMEGLWQGRMLVPSVPALQALLDTDERPLSNDVIHSDTIQMRPVVFRMKEFACAMPLGCGRVDPHHHGSAHSALDPRLPAHNAPRSGWLPPGTRLVVSEDGKTCNAVTADGRVYPYRSVNEPVDPETCEGCVIRERVGREGMERVFEQYGLGLGTPVGGGRVAMGQNAREVAGQACGQCGGRRRIPTRDFMYAFGRPAQEDDGWDVGSPDDEGAAMDATEDAHDGSPMDVGADANQHRPPCDCRTTPPRALKECCHTSSILLVGTTDERHAAAWFDWEYYGRVRSCDGMIGLLRFPKAGSPFATGHFHASYTFFYGYIHGGRNFVGTWRRVFPDGTMGPVLFGENGEDIGGAGEGGAEIFLEGPFSFAKVEEKAEEEDDKKKARASA